MSKNLFDDFNTLAIISTFNKEIESSKLLFNQLSGKLDILEENSHYIYLNIDINSINNTYDRLNQVVNNLNDLLLQFEKIVENNRKLLIKEICDIQNNILTEEIKNNGLKLTEQMETLNQLQKEVEMRKEILRSTSLKTTKQENMEHFICWSNFPYLSNDIISKANQK